MSSDYNFNFPPPSSMFGPGASMGYGGISHGMGIGMGIPGGMHTSGTSGTSNSAGQSMPHYAATSPPPDFGGASAGGSSSHQLPSGGAPLKSLKISAVLNDLAIINRHLTHAEMLEVQHAQQIHVLEAKFAEQLEAVQRQWDLQLSEVQQAWNTDGTDEEGMDKELEKDVVRMEKSAAAYGDNGLKAVVCMVFQTLMGVRKLTADTLPAYPKDGATWPVDEATKERLLRFCITRIFQYIHKNSISVCPSSGPALRDISDEDLHDRIVKKYQGLQRNIRHAGTVPPGAETITPSDGTDPVVIAPSAPIKLPS
ncbi:uncharacterized protein BJ212DRAFT_1486690 [Suillus subaureus]|uniref:Uncharacterized protein n=1 Tax=Suillus subaureus TaxID=48587 RepID=A0A9P7J604_9AGAM|nr:uncharacterized protein BJ212DRAFT_1486690 [Suillus subaureus]KAG1804407.1 hypothetical protein BJ212DRAFT_1486690 [Suillus subaureus]